MRQWCLGFILPLVAISAFLMLRGSGTAEAWVDDEPGATGSRESSSTASPSAWKRTTRSASLRDPAAAIDICSQHPANCPVDEETWAGEPGAWQNTAKRWQQLSTTPGRKDVVWVWSMPYAGPNAAYDGQRENHYSDLTDAPYDSPVFSHNDPYVYDWERWEAVEGNYLFHQYGRASEAEAFQIGETDCQSGVYYPVVDDQVDYVYTPLSVLRDGECVSGGYISAHRGEMWGEPLSPLRFRLCDNPATGIPETESPRGNAVCKISPYVGIVYPRYAFNSTASLPAVVGCEAVLYAWGWSKPQQASGGQEYEAWFRNGELRFSMWINLSDQVGSSLPAADDHQWWNSRCEHAWSAVTNILYTGVYKIGPTVYTDSLAWPIQVAAMIPISGGSLTSAIDGVVYTFPANTFAEPVTVTHTIRFQGEAPGQGDLRGVNRFYEVAAVTRATGQPAQPTGPYTVTIQFTGSAAGPVMDNTLAAYSWQAGQWMKEPTSVVDPEVHTVVATPSHFSLWAVLGEARRVFLPSVLRNAR